MKLDKISKPKTFWYEDKEGQEIPYDTRQGFPDDFEGGEMYQHYRGVEVRHSICKQYKEPAWPVKALKWMIREMPNSWQGNSSQVYAGSSTVGPSYPVIKYLIEHDGFSFNEAVVAFSLMCERCINYYLVVLANEQVSPDYFDTVNTSCEYCKEIDPPHYQKRKLWACYRTMKLGGDVKRSWKTMGVYSNEEYMKKHGVSYNVNG